MGILAVAQRFRHLTTPSVPDAGQSSLYFKSDGFLYSMDSSGLETRIGPNAGAPLTQPQQAVATANAEPTNTTIIAVPGLSLTLPAAPGAIWEATLSLDVSIVTANGINVSYLYVNGTAQDAQLIVGGPAGARTHASKTFLVGGLIPNGTSQIDVRTRSNAAAQTTRVLGSHSTLIVKRIA